MEKNDLASRIALAQEKHDKGYNCAQSVCCAFCDLTDFDEETVFRLTEGLGLGMGGMDGTCGAISAAAVLSGAKCSTGNLETPNSKGTSYRQAKVCLQKFKEKNGALACRDLKGVDTGVVLRPCSGCISDAVEIIAQELFGE